LQIELERYAQDAAYRLFQAREADLRAADRRQSMLDAEIGQSRMIWEGVLGALFMLGLGACIESIPPQFALVKISISVSMTMIVIAHFFRVEMSFRNTTRAIRVLRRSLEGARELYASHSERKVRLQNTQHARVKEDMLLRSLAEYEGENGTPASTRERRRHLDAIAAIDRQRLTEEAEYERHGGDFWWEILRASLTFRIPGFVYAYVVYAQEGRDGGEWKKHARGLIDALAQIPALREQDDPLSRYFGRPENRAELKRAIDQASPYSLDSFKDLLDLCRKKMGYQGPGVSHLAPEQFRQLLSPR